MSHFCTQCGTKLAADSLFCNRCGAAVAEAFPEPENFLSNPPPVHEIGVPQDAPTTQEIEDLLNSPISSNTASENTEDEEEALPVSVEFKAKRQAAAITSILISFILFLSITAGQSWFVLRNGINNQTVKTVAKAVLNEVDIAEFPIFNFVPIPKGLDKRIKADNKAPLDQVIYNSIDEYYTLNFDIEQDDIKQLLEHELFKDFFGGVIDNYVDYIMGGDNVRVIASDRIVGLIEDNKDEIEEITSYSLVQSDFDDIKRVLQDSGIDNLTWNSAGVVGDNSGIRSLFSIINREPAASLIVIITAAVISTVLLIIINRRRISNTLLYFGVPCIISGVCFIAARIIGADLLFSWISDNLGIGTASVKAVMQDTFSSAGNVMMFSGLAVLAVGVAAIAVRVMFRKTI